MENTYTLINSYSEYLDIMGLDEQQYNEYIQEASSFFKNKKVTPLIEKSKKSYRHNMMVIKRVLKDHGIDVKKLENESRRVGNSIKSDLKNGNVKSITKKIADTINVFIKDSSQDLLLSTDSKVKRSILLFICMLAIGLCFSTPFSLISLDVVIPVIIGPITEEIAKNIAIEGKYPWIYTGIFSGIEFVQYVIILLISGATLGGTVLLRLAAVVMHFVTTMIQKYFKEKGDKIDDDTKNITGLYIGTAVHVTFNVLALVFDKKIMGMLGIKY